MDRALTIETIKEATEQLVGAGLITKDQLAVARVTKQTLGGDLPQILIKKGFIDQSAMRDFMVQQLQLEEISLSTLPIDPSVVKSVPLSVAERYQFMPLYRVEDIMTIAVSDPLSLFGLADMQGALNCAIRPVLASREQIAAAVRLHYHAQNEQSLPPDDSVHVVGQKAATSDDNKDELEEMAARERVVTVVNNIINKAVRNRASDIHIEPQQEDTRVRFRMDGMLQEVAVFPKALHLPLVSRLKVMAGMDIAERRIPQDGRVRLKVQSTTIDLRLSTYPSMYGEKVVTRLLIKSGVMTLEQLGLAAEDKGRFSDLIQKPHGIFLVTGPTGSGKSSTLYAALQRLNSQERNIVSIEDPVENEIAGITQAQVNVKAGMTFAAALRSILRQDPDVIMVGEIRDKETAEMAVRAALTGHLVFSTLHTNTAAGAVERLHDMDVERFLIGSALIGVMAQRLVRKLCASCRVEVDPDPGTLHQLGLSAWDGKLYRGRGCNECRMSGYRGRIGIFELLLVDGELKQRIARGATEEEIKAYGREHGSHDMRIDGYAKVKAGVTTLEEVLRVTQEE